jgi:microcystin-dependent protein
VAHTLTIAELPTHTHTAQAATADGDTPIATANMLGAFNNGYGSAGNLTPLLSSSIGNVGGSQAHDNMSPFLVLNYIIALQGIFPSRN